MNKDIYQIITDRFVAQLERGTVPWQRPWISPQNMASQKPYHGVNIFTLACEERESPFWLTYRQASELGGNVKPGEKSTPVVYWQMLERQDKNGTVMLNSNGRPEVMPFIRWSNVFNIEQTQGIQQPELSIETVQQPALDKAKAILDSANFCQIKKNGQNDRAVYCPATDTIEIPSVKRFPNKADWFHTIFHELGHSTGSADRLNREGIAEKIEPGSEKYAKEELIAELCASFLSNEAGTLGDVQFKNSSSYLKSWITRLQNNPKVIVMACAAAQKACRFVLGERENVSSSIKEMIAGLNSAKAPELQNERA